MMLAARIPDDDAERQKPRTELDEAIERLDAARKKMKAKQRERKTPMPQRFYWQDRD